MIEFTLSRRKETALPTAVTVNGGAVDIRPDFRNILRILRMRADPDVLEGHKDALLCKWFFVDAVPDNWPELFGWFLRVGDDPETGGGVAFDYEFDAPEVYASFLQLYGIDLFETDMHWWQFRALLSGCFACRCALSEKLRLRDLDVSKCPDRAAAQRAKDAAQLPTRLGTDEQILTAQITERLMRGEPIDDLMR